MLGAITFFFYFIRNGALRFFKVSRGSSACDVSMRFSALDMKIGNSKYGSTSLARSSLQLPLKGTDPPSINVVTMLHFDDY